MTAQVNPNAPCVIVYMQRLEPGREHCANLRDAIENAAWSSFEGEYSPTVIEDTDGNVIVDRELLRDIIINHMEHFTPDGRLRTWLRWDGWPFLTGE